MAVIIPVPVPADPSLGASMAAGYLIGFGLVAIALGMSLLLPPKTLRPVGWVVAGGLSLAGIGMISGAVFLLAKFVL